jgi:hypothetical protein
MSKGTNAHGHCSSYNAKEVTLTSSSATLLELAHVKTFICLAEELKLGQSSEIPPSVGLDEDLHKKKDMRVGREGRQVQMFKFGSHFRNLH